MIKWLKLIWQGIVESNDDVYKDIISSQKKTIKELNNHISKLSYEKQEEVDNPGIEFKSNDFPYLPHWLVFFWDNGIKSKKVRFTPSKFYKVWSDEMYKHFNKIAKKHKSFDDKVVALRNEIRKKVKYEHDSGHTGNKAENWRLPPETWYGGIGDCDDMAILWVAACKMCGLPANRVYNATGYVNWLNKEYGHSFGIAKFDDGEWYVVDSTSTKVVKLQGSDFKIKGFLRGATNWHFKGVPKTEQF